MKVAILKKYSRKNSQLDIVDRSIPSIKDNEVLIKVLTAAVNPLDNIIRRGKIKLLFPYKLPLIMGNEAVGIVEKTGKNIKNFKVNDRVFARLPIRHIGAFAEYIAIEENALVLVPDYLTNEEAACIPLTALTIMQAFELMKIEAGKTLFISGGTGSLGAIAIPIAKAKGLTVITSGNISNKERLFSFGLDHFINYKEEDYTKILTNIDYVLDTLGGKEIEKQLSILKKGGKLVSLKGIPNENFAKNANLPLWKQLLCKLASYKITKLAKKLNVEYHFVFVESNGKQLQEVANLFSLLKIKPSIDEIFKFDDINKALDKIENTSSKGKTIIKFY